MDDETLNCVSVRFEKNELKTYEFLEETNCTKDSVGTPINYFQHQEGEINDKDFCVDEFNKNQLTTEKTAREKMANDLHYYDMLKYPAMDQRQWARPRARPWISLRRRRRRP